MEGAFVHRAIFWAIFDSQPCFWRRMGEWVGLLPGLCSHVNLSPVVAVPKGFIGDGELGDSIQESHNKSGAQSARRSNTPHACCVRDFSWPLDRFVSRFAAIVPFCPAIQVYSPLVS